MAVRGVFLTRKLGDLAVCLDQLQHGCWRGVCWCVCGYLDSGQCGSKAMREGVGLKCSSPCSVTFGAFV